MRSGEEEGEEGIEKGKWNWRKKCIRSLDAGISSVVYKEGGEVIS